MVEVPKVLVPNFYRPELEHVPCRDVQKDDAPALPELIEKMAQFCHDFGGDGLAAPQVGIFIRLAVVLAKPKKIHVLINPIITSFGGKDILAAEGCLSIPPPQVAQARVWRSEVIHLASGTIADPEARIESLHKGWEARVIQHEVDHLNPEGGIFFINRIGPVARQIVLRKFTKRLRRMDETLRGHLKEAKAS